MTNAELAARYLPIFCFDEAETIPLRAVGWTVFRETRRSDSFPKREVPVTFGAETAIEYACYWDYDIQHMYDLEHVWVYLDGENRVIRAEGSFHGKYLNLWAPGLEKAGATAPEEGRVFAFSQPGKHAMVPCGELCRLVPDWDRCCREHAGGPVLVGGPFEGIYSATEEEDRNSIRYIRENLCFVPTLRFRRGGEKALLLPWGELKEKIPEWVAAECGRLKKHYGN